MNCARFEERVLQLLDRREDIAAAVDLIPHANRCARCAKTREIGMVMGVVPAARPEDEAFPVPEGFADRVLSAWRTESVTVVAAGVNAASDASEGNLTGADAALQDDWGWTEGVIGESGMESGDSVSQSNRFGGWVKPLAWFATVAAAMLLLVWLEGFGERAVPERLEPLAARSVPRSGESPFVMVEVDRWTPVLNSLGDESLAVVRPLTRSLHLAYDLLKQHLLGGDGLEKIDARRFEIDVYWS